MIAMIVTTAGADLVQLLSKGVTRINKIRKFFTVTLSKSDNRENIYKQTKT